MIGKKFVTVEYETWSEQQGIYVNPKRKQVCINIEDLRDLFKVLLETLGEQNEKTTV